EFTTYVAWIYTVSLDSARRLGPVRNGRVDLGEVSYAQFRILITAERSTQVVERRGRLVLRGTSPSARRLAHRDVMQPAAPGALIDSVPGRTAMSNAMSSMHGTPSSAGASSDRTQWTMPPM